jgi:hypothetical protein
MRKPTRCAECHHYRTLITANGQPFGKKCHEALCEMKYKFLPEDAPACEHAAVQESEKLVNA